MYIFIVKELIRVPELLILLLNIIHVLFCGKVENKLMKYQLQIS